MLYFDLHTLLFQPPCCLLVVVVSSDVGMVVMAVRVAPAVVGKPARERLG